MSSTPNKKSGKVSSAVIEIDLDPAPAATQEVEMVQEIKQEETTSTHNIASSSQSTSDEIPIFIKSSVLSNKRLLACEIDDSRLDFSGDSGAIGRLSCCDRDNNSTSGTINNKVTVDLIGKQYSGMIQTGPTMMFINLSYQTNSEVSTGEEGSTENAAKVVKQVGKVEGITNEVCKLRFDQDVLGDIFGIYTRDEEAEEDEDDGEDGGEDEGAKKKRKLEDAAGKVHKGKKATSFAVNKAKSKSKSKSKAKSKKGSK